MNSSELNVNKTLDEIINLIVQGSEGLITWVVQRQKKKVQKWEQDLEPEELQGFKGWLNKIGIKPVEPSDEGEDLFCLSKEDLEKLKSLGHKVLFFQNGSQELKKIKLKEIYKHILAEEIHRDTWRDSDDICQLPENITEKFITELLNKNKKKRKNHLKKILEAAILESKINNHSNVPGFFLLNVLEVFEYLRGEGLSFKKVTSDLTSSFQLKKMFFDGKNFNEEEFKLWKAHNFYLHVLSGIILMVKEAHKIYKSNTSKEYNDKFCSFLERLPDNPTAEAIMKEPEFSLLFEQSKIKADGKALKEALFFIERWEVLLDDIKEIAAVLEGDDRKGAVFCRWYGMLCFLAFNEFVDSGDDRPIPRQDDFIDFPLLAQFGSWGIDVSHEEIDSMKNTFKKAHLDRLRTKSKFPFKPISRKETMSDGKEREKTDTTIRFDSRGKGKINLFDENMGFSTKRNKTGKKMESDESKKK